MDTNTTHGNVKETDNSNSKSNELIEMVKLEGTPFTAIRNDDKWYLTLGKYRLTEELKSLEEAKAESLDASWERIMQIIQIMIDEDRTNRKETTEIINQTKLNY